MNEYKYLDYIEGYSGFEYSFEIPITSVDYKYKVLEFDQAFLRSGAKFGFFKYQIDTHIDLFIKRRQKNFFSENRKWLSLVDVEQFEDTTKKHMTAMLPNSEGNLESVTYHQPFIGLRFLEFESTPVLHWSQLEHLSYWFETVSISLFSKSNIWLAETDLIMDDDGRLLKLDTLRDNRFYAYRIAPRFNSFLRDLIIKTTELGGTVTLGEHDAKNVTEQGLFLDGKIIYQEDIDEGKVNFPAL